MFTIIKSAFGRTSKNPYLGPDERLFTLKLQNVTNPLDPYPLWEHRFGGDSSISESTTGSTHKRLKNALDVHRCTAVVADDRGWKAGSKRVFTDVVIRIPNKAYQDDVSLGARKLEIFSDNLAQLHQHDFGNDLCLERFPSYVVIPDTSLRRDEVSIQFGLGVFVPLSKDELCGELYMRLGDQTGWLLLEQWVFWENGLKLFRPAGLYMQQQFLLISPSSRLAAVRPPVSESGKEVWLGHNQGYIYILLYPGMEKHQQVLGDNRVISNPEVVTHDDAGATTIYRFTDLNLDKHKSAGKDEQLLLKIDQSVTPAVTREGDARKGSVIQMNSRATLLSDKNKKSESASKGLTIIKGQKNDQLILEGLALPRIDIQPEKIPGLKYWIISLDSSGKIVNKKTSDVSIFAGTADHDCLLYHPPGTKKFRVVRQFPFNITDSDGGSFEIINSPLQDKYHGILQFPNPLFHSLHQSVTVVGRNDPNPNANQPDIDLGLLDNPATLHWQQGSEPPGACLDAMNLHRRHVEVRTKNGELHVDLITGGAASVFSLDQEGCLKDTLHPGVAKSMILTPGERLLVGCYLLRYER